MKEARAEVNMHLRGSKCSQLPGKGARLLSTTLSTRRASQHCVSQSPTHTLPSIPQSLLVTGLFFLKKYRVPQK